MKILALILALVANGQPSTFADEANRLVILAAAAKAREADQPSAPAVHSDGPVQPWEDQVLVVSKFADLKDRKQGGLVYIWNDGCPNCVLFERDSLSNRAVIEKFNDFPAFAKVKYSEDWRPIFAAYGMTPTFPALAIVDSNNRIVGLSTCPHKPGEVLALFEEN